MKKIVTGRAKGGLATANLMTPSQRAARANKGAIARWGLKATHKGNFKDDFGIDVECYVLNDPTKTAVISQRGMGAALGYSEGGSRFSSLIKSKTLSEHLGRELIEKIEKPLIFQSAQVGANSPPASKTHGYDVTILIDVCKAVVAAENAGSLLKSQANIAKQAHVILTASAKAGIKGLVYALSGYDATRQEIIESFKLFVRNEARDYEREFPEQLYREWYRIYQLPKPERNKPWKFMHLTNSHVYQPLANSSGKVQQLITAQRNGTKEDKNKRLHQFLSEIGVKALRQHLGQLLGIAQLSDNKMEYEKNFKKVFGSQPELPFED